MERPCITEKGNQKVLLVDGKPFIMLAGEVHNSDSFSPAYMEQIWKIAEELGMNSLLLPVTWEMVEPVEGEFHFEVLDQLIDQAREHGMKIGLLWFGSFKNAECMYAPEWVKRDLERFHRGQIVKGKSKAGRRVSPTLPVTIPYTTISYLSENAMQADARAFGKMMQHVREYDEAYGTVITVQVENETGLLGNAREVSDEADAAFAGEVPQEFASYMRSHTEYMEEDVRAAVEAGAEKGSWRDVFGTAAEEIFSAYHVASFVEYVAKAGKDAYDLPMAVNCWLDKAADTPGDYPSGGPVARVHEVWDYCAPSIDVYCPDIYVPYFNKVCDRFIKSGTNPLYIPEAATHSYAAPRMVYTVGHYHAMCYSPFGFDDIGKPFSAAQGYLFGMDVTDPALKTPQNFEEYAALGKILREAMPLLAERYGTTDLQAVCAEREAEKKKSLGLPEDMNPMERMMAEAAAATKMIFGDLGVSAGFGGMMRPRNDGALLVCRTKENEVYMIGEQCDIQLFSANSEKTNLDILRLEEGTFENGVFVPGRRFNGDETAQLKLDKPGVLRLQWFTYE
mgnify:FL=1